MNRPRPALIILGLATLAVIALADFQVRFFLMEFRTRSLGLMREKIGLDGQIGSVEGGIFRGVALKGVRLYGILPSQAKKVFFSSDAINLDYRLWDIALGRYNKLEKIILVSPKLYFIESHEKLAIPKVFEPAWKEITISVKDGSFYNEQGLSLISEFNGSFRVSDKGIESQSVNANILGQKFSGRGRLGFPIEKSSFGLDGAIKGGGYALRARLDGALERISVRGSFDILDRLEMGFAGNIATSEGAIAFNDFRLGPDFMLNGLLQTAKKGFSIVLYPKDTSGNAAALGEVSRLGISGDFSNLPYFVMTLNANHLKLAGFDLMSNYSISGKLIYGEANRLKSVTGDFSTSGSLINYDPVRELKGAYEIKDGVLRLLGANYGDVVLASGSVSLAGKNETELHLKFKGAQLGGLTDLTMEKGLVSGLVFGDIDIRGEAGKPLTIDGQLEFLNGNISTIRYSSAKLNLKGKGPILEFVDSKVYTEGEVLTLEGRIDMRDIGTSRVFRNIAIKSDPNTVVWAGTSVTKTGSGEEYVAGTDVNEQFRVNFRTYESQRSDQQRPRPDEMELEYKLGKPGNLKLKMKENNDFFGVEHKVKF